MGIVKFDEKGIEVVADRKGRFAFEDGFVKSQIFRAEQPTKSLKFSGYFDGRFFGSVGELLHSLDPELESEPKETDGTLSVPFLPVDSIKDSVRTILRQAHYSGGPVNLDKVCDVLSIELQHSHQQILDSDGMPTARRRFS